MSPWSVTDRPGSVERSLPPQPASVAEARRTVRELLEAAGREDLVESAVLLVSELVTNALLHAGTTIDLTAVLDGGLRVEVGDGSEHLPVRRRYATTAGTGRGLMMLEEVGDAWGVHRREVGKVVWFEIGRGELTDPAERAEDGRGTGAAGEVEVELLQVPLLLHQAWQEHAEALLREYLLVTLDGDGDEDPIQVHADATDAIAVLEEHVPRAEVAVRPHALMADATDPHLTAQVVRIPVPRQSVGHFATLDRTIEAALALARDGLVLTPPTQPEIRGFRQWLCAEVRRQSAGQPPQPWEVDDLPDPPEGASPEWDASAVSSAAAGLVAADEANRILAVSPSVAALLGYEDPAELVGRRLVTLVPERFRQAHIAGFTMYLLVGRRPLIGTPVRVPALRRDGSEVLVELTINVEGAGDGRTVFLASMERAAS